MRLIALTASGASLIATQSTYSSVASISARSARGEHRPARPLVDEVVGRDGDDQHVAELARRLEMTHVAEMQQVERAVRLHHAAAGLAQLRGRTYNLWPIRAASERGRDLRTKQEQCQATDYVTTASAASSAPTS